MSEFVAKLVVGVIAAAGAIALVVITALLFALPVKWTWNATMPYLFALKELSVGQAWCLAFLAGSLIKSSTVVKAEEK